MTAALFERSAPLEIELSAEADSVGTARHAVAEFAERMGADSDDVALAVSEAVSNAVIHAYPRDSHRRAGGRIDVRAIAEPDAVVISVSDDGVGVMPNPDSPGLGLGLALIGSLSDRVELHKEGRGTTLIMRFPRTA